MEIIRLESIHFDYPQDIRVFKGLDFSVAAGERIGIVGSNGSGKTTLLSLIMGLLKPSSGEIYLFGEKREKEEEGASWKKREWRQIHEEGFGNY